MFGVAYAVNRLNNNRIHLLGDEVLYLTELLPQYLTGRPRIGYLPLAPSPRTITVQVRTNLPRLTRQLSFKQHQSEGNLFSRR